MNLRDEFLKYKYEDILDNDTPQGAICLDDIFDRDNKPEELLSIFISSKRDELFFVLDGQARDINTLCENWDEKIRIFTLINSDSKAIKKLKYNIIQLVISPLDFEERNKGIEGDLSITRKIILKGNISDNNVIEINEKVLNEVPFFDVSIENVSLDEEKIEKLKLLLPPNKELKSFMEKEHHKERKRDKTSFEESDFNKIRMWIEK